MTVVIPADYALINEQCRSSLRSIHLSGCSSGSAMQSNSLSRSASNLVVWSDVRKHRMQNPARACIAGATIASSDNAGSRHFVDGRQFLLWNYCRVARHTITQSYLSPTRRDGMPKTEICSIILETYCIPIEGLLYMGLQ